MTDLSSMLAILPLLMESLPLILLATQIMMYVFFAWFFGSIVIKGYRRHLSFPIKIVSVFGLGFISLIAGIAFSTISPILNEEIFKLLQINIMVNGLIASIILAISLYSLSYKNRPSSSKVMIEKLKMKVSELEELLMKNKAKYISESEAQSSAESLLKGYKAVKASLNDNEWEILLTKGKRGAKVILDAWDGEVKKVIHPRSIMNFLYPARIIGIGIIVCFLVFSLLNFQGFPTMSEGFSNLFGMSPEELSSVFGSMGEGLPSFGILEQQVPEGCVSALAIFSKLGPQLADEQFLKDHLYTNSEMKNIIEQNAQASVMTMFKIDYEGKEIVMAFTDNARVCHTTDGKFCGCIETK